MSGKLTEYTKTCIISFVDSYKKTISNTKESFILPISEDQMKEVAKAFSEIADKRGMELKSCAETIDLEQFGIPHASCIDSELIEKITGMRLASGVRKDGQRNGCKCIECIDTGAYDTCINGCSYCYANACFEKAKTYYRMHNPKSEILGLEIIGDEKITDRKVRTILDKQLQL